MIKNNDENCVDWDKWQDLQRETNPIYHINKLNDGLITNFGGGIVEITVSKKVWSNIEERIGALRKPNEGFGQNQITWHTKSGSITIKGEK